VELSRPQAGSSAIAHGTGICSKTGDNWHCYLDWTVNDQSVSGQADIGQQEFAGESDTIPARAIGDLAVSVGAQPHAISNQVLLGAIPIWVALAAAVAEVAAWTAALRIFAALTGIGIFRARQPTVTRPAGGAG
jgi:hypothetical protein